MPPAAFYSPLKLRLSRLSSPERDLQVAFIFSSGWVANRSHGRFIMVALDLSDAEIAILAEILESTLSDLRMEIADTDSMDYREMLKQRKAVLTKALEALRPT